MQLDAEVGIVGLGTMGSMALWQTARRGTSVIGLEQFAIGHQLGAGAGEARQFRANHLEHEVRAVMAHALGQYRELEADSGFSLLTLTGGLTIGPGDSDLVQTLVGRMRAEGDSPAFLSAREMSVRFPQHRLGRDDVVVWNAESGFVRPEHAIVAAVTSARRHGARVAPGSSVTDIEPGDGFVRLHTPHRSWTVHKAIVTAGPWAWDLLPSLVPGAQLGRLLLTWFPTARPELFGVERFPTFTRLVEDRLVYGLPSLWEGTVRVGPAGPREMFKGPGNLNRVSVPHDELESITRIVKRWMPDLIPTVIRTGTHLDAYTPDGQPVVGPVDDDGDVLVAAGFSGRGFKLAPVVGRILSDLATVGGTAIDISAWAPSRFRGTSPEAPWAHSSVSMNTLR